MKLIHAFCSDSDILDGLRLCNLNAAAEPAGMVQSSFHHRNYSKLHHELADACAAVSPCQPCVATLPVLTYAHVKRPGNTNTMKYM